MRPVSRMKNIFDLIKEPRVGNHIPHRPQEEISIMICPRCNKPYTAYPAVSRHGHGDICPQCGKEEAFLDAGFKNAVEKALHVQRLEDETREKIELMNAGKLPASEVINSYDQ